MPLSTGQCQEVRGLGVMSGKSIHHLLLPVGTDARRYVSPGLSRQQSHCRR